MTLFQRILDGTASCHRVYEDEHVLAFLDTRPLSRGHTLVIPKESAVTLDQLSEKSAAALGRALPRICRAIVQATGIRDYNVLQNNGAVAHQVVQHVHFHVIPKPDKAEGLGIEWPATELDERDALELARTIREGLLFAAA